jgi:tRNA modification GTPase
VTDSAPVGWVARLTPPGKSALATLACRGPGAWDVLRELFRPLSGTALPAAPPVGQFWLGHLGEDGAEQTVLAVRRGLPLPWLELHCHGGREVVLYLQQLLQTRGLVPCGWQEFLAREEADALRAAAAVALTETTTARTAAIVLDQYHGALGVALAAVVAALDAGQLESARALLSDLVRHAPLGRRLTTPWRVVLAGAPNVGKSSLLNALAGFQRSIVSPVPGTTRDVVTTRTALDGWPVELADTAGLRAGTEALEEEGVGKARATAAAADLCLLVLDASVAAVWPTPDVGPARLVVNKIDLPPAWDLNAAGDAPRVSARTGAGLEELCRSLARGLVPQPPAPGAAVPFTPTLTAVVEQALQALQAGQPEQTRELLQRARTGSAEMPDTSLKSPPVRG